MHDDRRDTLSTRQAVERGLAVVGFVALIGFGIWLAIYSSRYVPVAVDRLGAAIVGFTSTFIPGDEPGLNVVPNGTTTIPFGPTTTPTGTTPKPTTSKPATKPTTVTPKPGTQTGSTYAQGTTTAHTAPTLHGLSDLSTTILAIGYLTSTSTDSFVASTTVPAGTRPAVKFSIQNVGTNVTPTTWHFSAAIPTYNAYVFFSPAQQVLAPGDRIEYTLGFDQASSGQNRSISVVADSDQRIGESNENNNSATRSITIN